MKLIRSSIICLVVLILLACLFVVSGVYNIAATVPHWRITSAILEVVRDRSIEVHSNDIQVPNLDNENYKKDAIGHFHDMCRLCHGAPGYNREEFAKGLYPAPPDLTSGYAQGELSDAELYWVVKNGIKLTGMPAFGPTHTEQQLWGLVALTRKIPSMSSEQYQTLVRKRQAQ